MDFKDSLRPLAERVLKLKDQIQTEEATKNAFIMPFIQCLGYDVFNPLEVVPEFVADIGTKKGEKVDYAIFKDGVPMILVECKHWAQKLDIHDNQLLRYFNVSKAKFAILTNGIRYKFYTDLVEPNKMDEKPFLEFDITDIRDIQVEELKKFHKSYFDISSILASASELKYTNEIKTILNNEFKNPTEAFVRYFTAQVYSGRITDKVIFQFSDLVKKSLHQVISEAITDRLKTALNQENQTVALNVTADAAAVVAPESTSESAPKERLIETTNEELEGFFIVKSILRQSLDAARITYRDAQSYFSVLLDDNNRKAICRLYFNGAKKYIGVFDSTKKETKIELAKLDDLYNHSEALKATLDVYLALK